MIALKQGLRALGWTDGRNIEIETRFGGADAGRIRAQATELVALAPDVLVGQRTPVIRALRQATSSIPIVMVPVIDPVEQGFVSSLAHPDGNITGFTFIDFQMVGMATSTGPKISSRARQARDDVIRTAWSEADHNAHRPRRVGLRGSDSTSISP